MVDDLLNQVLQGLDPEFITPEERPAPEEIPEVIPPERIELIQPLRQTPGTFVQRFAQAFGRPIHTSTKGFRFEFIGPGGGKEFIELEDDDIRFMSGLISPTEYEELLAQQERTQSAKGNFQKLFTFSVSARMPEGGRIFTEDEVASFKQMWNATSQIDFETRRPISAFFGGFAPEIPEAEQPAGFTQIARLAAEPLRRISGGLSEILEAGKTPVEEASIPGYLKNTLLSSLGFFTGIPGFIGETGERAVEIAESGALNPALADLFGTKATFEEARARGVVAAERTGDFLKGFGGVITPLVESYLAETPEERAIKAEEAERLAFEDPIAAGAPILAVVAGRSGLKRVRRSSAARTWRQRFAAFQETPTPQAMTALLEATQTLERITKPSPTSVFIKNALKKPINALRQSRFGERAELITERLKETAVGSKVNDAVQTVIEKGWRQPSEINAEAWATAMGVERKIAQHLFETQKETANLEARASLGLEDAAIRELPLGERLLSKFVDSFQRIPVMKEFMRRATGRRGFKLTPEERGTMFVAMEGVDFGPGGEIIFGARERVLNAKESAAFLGDLRRRGGLKITDETIRAIREENLQLPDTIFSNKKGAKTIEQMAKELAEPLELPEIRAQEHIISALRSYGLDNMNKVWRRRTLPDGTEIELNPANAERLFSELPVHQQQVVLDMRGINNELIHIYDIGKGRTVKIEQLQEIRDKKFDAIARTQIRRINKIEKDFDFETKRLANIDKNTKTLNRLFEKAIQENDATLITRIERLVDQMAERTPEIEAVRNQIKARMAMVEMNAVEPTFRPLEREVRAREERLRAQRDAQRIKVDNQFQRMIDKVQRSDGAEIQRLEQGGLPEAHVHHYFAKNGFVQSLLGILRRRGRIKAGPRRFRAGAEGFETNPFQALFREKVALERERVINDALPTIEQQLAVPLAKGEKVPIGHFETTGKFGGLQGKRIAIHSAFEPHWKRFTRSLDQDAFDSIAKAAGTYYKQTLLFSPDQVLVQTYGILHEIGTKALVDFFRDAFNDRAIWREIQGPATGMARAMQAMWNVERMDPFLREVLAPEQFIGKAGARRALGPEALREGLPIISPIMQKMMELIAMPDQFGKITLGIREVERITRPIDRAIRAGEITEAEGLILKKFMLRDPKVMSHVATQLNVYAFDYADVSLWLEKFRNSALGPFIIPFSTFAFKSLKSFQFHVWDAINPKSKLRPRERLARLLGYGISVLPAVIAQQILMGPIDPEDTEGGGVADITDHIHVTSYEDQGKHYHLYLNFARQSPRLAIAQALAGGSPWDDVKEFMGEDFQTLGPFARLAGRYAGFSNKYDQYKPTSVVVGEQIRVFIPFSRVLQNAARLTDPLRRRPRDFVEAVKVGIPGLRESVPPTGRAESQLQAALSVAGVRTRVLEEEELLRAAEQGGARREREELGIAEIERLQRRLRRVGRETGLTEEEQEAVIQDLLRAIEEVQRESERLQSRRFKESNRQFRLDLRRLRQRVGVQTND